MMPIVVYPSEDLTKYRSRRVVIDGEAFDSEGEAARWHELRFLEHQGLVMELSRQVKFELHAGDRSHLKLIGSYIADFVYYENHGTAEAPKWRRMVEDFKGFRTQLYLWKKKHVEAEYDVTVTETDARRRS